MQSDLRLILDEVIYHFVKQTHRAQGVVRYPFLGGFDLNLVSSTALLRDLQPVCMLSM